MDKEFRGLEWLSYAWIAVALALCYALAGCANRTEWYENGQLKCVDRGFDPRWNWSDGPNKQLPLSNISLSGIGGNAGGIVK